MASEMEPGHEFSDTGQAGDKKWHRHAPKLLSHIHPLRLEESIGGAQGQYASVSILEPVMRIERSRPIGPSSSPKTTYRIIVHFIVQFSINNFDRRSVGRHNRIFDSIIVRYLYRNGERHTILPPGDSLASDIQVTNEMGVSGDVQFGLSAMNGQPTPSVIVHAQNETKVTYERKLRSWRKGLSYEPYPPPPQPQEKSRPVSPFMALVGATQSSPLNPDSSFQVSSLHREDCLCRPPPFEHHHHECHYRSSRRQPYNRAAHWSGQTEAQLHLWTPEIYENINVPITISREVDAAEIDRILGTRTHSRRDINLLRRALHFDFDVETRLREIGWRFWDIFKSSSQPAEMRARNDPGKPLDPDRARFCISCCVESVHWPQHETRNLQGEAEQQIATYGHVHQLPTAEEYERQQNESAAHWRRASWSYGGPDGLARRVSRGRQSDDSGYVSEHHDMVEVPARRIHKRISFSPNNRLRTFQTGRLSRSRHASPVDVPRPPTPPSPCLPLSDYLGLPPYDMSSSPRRAAGARRPTQGAGGVDSPSSVDYPPIVRSPFLTHRERRARSRRSSLDDLPPGYRHRRRSQSSSSRR